MTKHWTIIDGHNTLHDVPRYRALLAADYASALGRLLTDVATISVSVEGKMVLVFDGTIDGRPYAGDNVEVLFSEDKTADEVIERLIRSAPKGTVLTVVTADVEHSRAVSRQGTRVVRPSSFFAEAGEETPTEEYSGRRTRVSLEDRVPEDVREKLERLRRGLDSS